MQQEQAVIVGEDGRVDMWHLSTGQIEHFHFGDSRLDAVAASPDQASLAVGSVNGEISVLDAATGEVKNTWQANEGPVRALVFMSDPDGMHLASAGVGAVIRLWDTDGQLQGELRGHQNDVNALALGAEPQTLLSASGDGSVRLWNWKTGEELREFTADIPLLTIAFSPDAQTIAAGGHGSKVHTWNLETSDPWPLDLPGDPVVRAVVWSADGNWLAAGDEHGTIHVWDWPTRARTFIRAYAESWGSGLAFSADQNRLLTTSRDGELRLWPVETGDTLDLACQRVGRELSPDEWSAFLPEKAMTVLCGRFPPEPWAEADRLDSPRPVTLPGFDFAPPDARPIIRYFEAVPGSVIAQGGSVTLRWNVESVRAVFLEYRDQQRGVTSPRAEQFWPTEDTVYRLIARNDAGERTLALLISLKQE